MIALFMFAVALFLLLIGIPVAFAFGGVAIIFAFLIPHLGFDVFSILPFRIYGIMSNTTLMAVPLFIAMGLILEKSQMSEKLLVSMSALFSFNQRRFGCKRCFGRGTSCRFNWDCLGFCRHDECHSTSSHAKCRI